MGKQLLKYFGAAAVLYIAVSHATGTGSLLVNGANGIAKIDKTVEGR